MKKSIAVLPFTPMSSSSDVEYIADGMAEEVINALTKIQELNVISRTSSFLYKQTTLSIAEIAKELNVAIILQGSIRLAGNSARITVQLIEAESEFHFWSDSFDRNLDDVFQVQDEISLLIADRLREHLGHFVYDDHLVDQYDIALSTYKKFLQGRFFLMQLDYTSSITAISIFDEVIQEAPNFPYSYLCVNQAYAYMGTMGIIPAFDAFTKAQPYLEKGIEMGPDLADTQLNLSWIACWQEWNLPKAYDHLNKALARQSKDNMYLTMANYLTLENKLDAAMKYLDKALELAPLSSTNVNYKGYLFYLKEEYDKAIPFFQRSLKLQADLPFPVLYLGACYMLQGQLEKGLEYFQAIKPNQSGFLFQLGGGTLAHAMLGNQEKTEAGIEALKKHLNSPSEGDALNYLIYIHCQLNEIDRALELTKVALEKHHPMLFLLPIDPLAKALWNNQEFKSLIAENFTFSERKELTRKYHQSLFSTDELDAHLKVLGELMDKDRVYLNPELSLRSLAEKMELSANHMSQLLNEGMQQNFADFVNSYRLQAFIAKLKTRKFHHLTLLALAYDSGFNSKSVFNAFFKKKMNMTPKAYLNSIKKS